MKFCVLYKDFPKQVVWHPQKAWKPQSKSSLSKFGRTISSVYSTLGEIFYLRMLLVHKMGAIYFEE